MKFRLESLINFNEPKPTGLSDNDREKPEILTIYDKIKPSAFDYKLADSMIRYYTWQ